MSDRAAPFLFSLIAVMGALAIAVWLVVSGQTAYMDGLFLLACCLLIATAFGVYLRVLIKEAGATTAEAKLPQRATLKEPAAEKPPAVSLQADH